MNEEEVLERVEKAYKAHKSSTSKWAKNYWLSVIEVLKESILHIRIQPLKQGVYYGKFEK